MSTPTIAPDRPDSGSPVAHLPVKPRRRFGRRLPPWWKRVSLFLVVFLTGLIVGSAIGGGSGAELSNLKAQLARANSRNASLSDRLSAADANRSDLASQNSSLQAQIDSLVREANAKRPLPRLIGMSKDEVLSLADQYGWEVTVKQKESARRPGTVLSQKPAEGTTMHLGALITIVVAKPLPPKMPDLIGKTRSDAERVADGHGWKLTVKREVSSQPAGTIISQTPSPGMFMRGAASFTVVIAKNAPLPAPSTGSSGSSSGGSTGSSSCDSNYSGQCLDPNASDYDCAGGSGNGPLYVSGTVRVVGVDHYGLDADGDGIGCE